MTTVAPQAGVPVGARLHLALIYLLSCTECLAVERAVCGALAQAVSGPLIETQMEEKSGGEPTDHPLDLTHYLQPNVANPSSEQVPAPGPDSQPPQVSAPQAPDALQENIFASLPQPDEGFQPFLSRQHEAAGPSGEPVPQQPEPRGSQVRQRKSSSRARAAAQRTWRDSSMEPEPRKRARGAQGDGSQAVARHIVTEQQRRDREKAGFAALRELVPMEEKLDKATFLKRVCSYISNLQVGGSAAP